MTEKEWERRAGTPAPLPIGQQRSPREKGNGKAATAENPDVTSTTPDVKLPMIVVRREFYDAFLNGSKTTEYRRNKRPFTTKTFYTGRTVRLAYHYNIRLYPSRLARINQTNIVQACSLDNFASLRKSYPDLTPEDEIICIGLDLLEEANPPSASSPLTPIGLVTMPSSQ
jgi:hypothetical protein